MALFDVTLTQTILITTSESIEASTEQEATLKLAAKHPGVLVYEDAEEIIIQDSNFSITKLN